jgi:hypothetical protein
MRSVDDQFIAAELIHADGTMTLNAKQIVNGGYKCGFLGMMTCEKGILPFLLVSMVMSPKD